MHFNPTYIFRNVVVLLTIFILFNNTIEAQQIFNFGATWKYYDAGYNLGTSWRNSNYNDNSWSSGPGQLGFNEGDEATLINRSNHNVTYYFRREFNIADINTIGGLDIDMIRDDGAVVYINGVEVWRTNMPGGTIYYNTRASSNASPENGINSYSVSPTNFLVNGTNVIAVEVHQRSSGSSDISFDMRLTATPPLADPPYVAFGANWRYNDSGNNLGTSWRNTNYNHNSWASGNAELGYGDGDEATTLNNSSQITNYFRKTFNANGFSPSEFLELSLKRDDGAVVYINGSEIWRENMPNGTINYNTIASSTIGGSEETEILKKIVPASILQQGSNTVAIEIHQRSSTSSDISMDFKIQNVGIPAITLDRGPYIQLQTQSSINLKWRTNIPINSVVMYGDSPFTLNNTIQDLTAVADHEVQIPNLQPGTTYYYSIGTTDSTFVGDANYFFKTAPLDNSTSLTRAWILGDAGTADNNQRNVRDAYLNYVNANGGQTDMILMLGDNAYNDGTDQQYQFAMFENMYEDILRNTVVWSCPGNHDMYTASSASQTGPYYDIFSFPKAGEAGGLASGTEAYYSWDYGQIHFISLDSDDTDRGIGSPMLTWLENDLASTTKEWIVAIFHHPPYTKGSHDSDDSGDSGGRMDDMRENVLPILEEYGVDVVLSGHSHSYERSYFLNGHYGKSNTFNNSMKVQDGGGQLDVDCSYKKYAGASEDGNGTVYLTAGSSGKVTGSLTKHAAIYAYLYQRGSVVIEVEDNRLDLKFVNENDQISDYFTIDKNINQGITRDTIDQGESITLTASWADDFDWNNSSATTQSITVSPNVSTQYIVKNASGCLADTFWVEVKVCEADEVTVNVSSCNPFTHGSQIDTFTNQSGCDSVVTIITDYPGGDAQLVVCTYQVTNLNDAGDGSLRYAIQQANAKPGNDKIEFVNLTGAGLKNIYLKSALPIISGPIDIDGYSQPNAQFFPNDDNDITIQIKGDSLPAGTNHGLVLNSNADNSIIQGLAFHNFSGNSIEVQSNNDGSTVKGNSIAIGIKNSMIPDVAENAAAISIDGSNTTIANNAIGDKIDNTQLPTAILLWGTGNGIKVKQGSIGNVITKNVIGNAYKSALEIASNDNIISNNIIGQNRNDDNISNREEAILLKGNASNNLIGGVNLENEIFNAVQESGASKGAIAVIENASGNTILNNLIKGTGGDNLSIDLGNDGATENDISDIANGPNDNFNYPVILSNTYNAGQFTISFSLDNNIPGLEGIRVNFFGSPTFESNGGTPECEVYVGHKDILLSQVQNARAEVNGNHSVVLNFPNPTFQNVFATATAILDSIDVNSSNSAVLRNALGSTSELGTNISSTLLPVELSYFDGEGVDCITKLTWMTLSELNNNYFEVQSSDDALKFDSLLQVKGKGTTNEISNYEVEVYQKEIAKYYRLKQVDFNGDVAFSNVILVTNQCDQENTSNVQIYPNPVKDKLIINASTEMKSIRIVSNTGYELLVAPNLNSKTFTIDVSSYQKGVYQIIIEDANLNFQSQKIIIIN